MTKTETERARNEHAEREKEKWAQNLGLHYLQKPWTKILLVVNVGSLEKRSDQPQYKEPRTRSLKTTAKLIENNVYCFL